MTTTRSFSIGLYLVIVFAFSWPFQLAFIVFGDRFRPILLVSMIMAGAGTFVAGRYVFRDGFEDAGWRWGRLRHYVLAFGLALFLWLVPVIIENVSGLWSKPWEPRWTTMLVSFIASFAITLVPAFGEEFSWRGYLLPRLLERFTTRKALLVHGSSPGCGTCRSSSRWDSSWRQRRRWQCRWCSRSAWSRRFCTQSSSPICGRSLAVCLWRPSTIRRSMRCATRCRNSSDSVPGRELAGCGADDIGSPAAVEGPVEHSVTRPPDRFGFWISTLTAVTTAITLVMAVLTPPKAGPFCADDCVAYPYTDFAAYIPRDFLWMYPALLVAPLFVVLLATMHEGTPPAWRPFTRSALAFGVMAATTLTAAYFIQLRFVQPAVLKGEFDGLAPLTQYNPHGVFIALEEAGYTLMAVTVLFAGLALPKASRLERALRWILVGGFVAVAVLFVVLSVVYGMDLEYRFEVAAITVDWTVLIVASTLLAIVHARSGQPPPA